MKRVPRSPVERGTVGAPETWLPIPEAAKYARLTQKALRRRIERGTVVSQRWEDGRRYVLLSSVEKDVPSPPRPAGEPRDQSPEWSIGEVLARLEALAAENGKLRALTEVAESTEQRLTAELVETRAALREAQAQLAVLEVQPRWRWWQRRG